MAKQQKQPATPTIRMTPLGSDSLPESEQLKEQFYELLLPEEYQELRQYLNNDGFLSNDEISASLRDQRLQQAEIADKLAALNLPTADKAMQALMAGYLWELHQILQDPALDHIRAKQRYRVERIEPVADATQQDEAQQTRPKKDRSLEIVSGGLIANFLHNFKKAYSPDAMPQVELVKNTRYHFQDVEASLAKMGITREELAETGNLDRLLKGEKTGLLEFAADVDGQKMTLRGKLYLVKQGDEITPYFQTVKQFLQIPDTYLGYAMTQADKVTLQQTGELGKRVELADQKTGETFNAYIGVDQETNSLTVWRAERVRQPVHIKGITLTGEQKETLAQGGVIRLVGMTSEHGHPFNADVQLSAGKRSLRFMPPSEAIKQTLDRKTAKGKGQLSGQRQGTSAEGVATKNKRPVQMVKKGEASHQATSPIGSQEKRPAGQKETATSRNKPRKRAREEGLDM